jgi:sigma-B regulation protein RsbU (phosphoserine phosphatase)
MRALVIDDDGALRTDMALNLADWGYEVKDASGGLLGFRIIRDWKPHVVICDIKMPNVSGRDLMQHIAQWKKDNPALVFIFASAVQTPQVAAQAMEAGADDYLRKPINSDELRAKIEEHVRNRMATLKSLGKQYS